MHPTFAAQSCESDAIHLDALPGHDIVLHAVRGAEPRYLPTARAHGLRDSQAGKNMTAGACRHDQQSLRAHHTRPPRIKILFS